MAEISRTTLFGKLNESGYKSLESAALFCKMRGNPYVELAHWLHQILQQPDSDIHRAIRQFELDPSRLASHITASLDALPRGATSISDISSHLEEAVERGWVYGSLLFGQSQVRTGFLLVGILKTANLRNVLMRISREFEKINLDVLTDQFATIMGPSVENVSVSSRPGAGESEGAAPAPAAMGKQEALARYSVDLTERARKGEIDPILARDEEIRQITDVLMRRRQNNPILAGEAGVGKTAVAEGFALRVASGDVPPPLKDVTVRSLDLGLLQAGAGMKGEFENRLRQVIDEVQSSPKPIILFIDEAHMLVGAGGAAGQGDAASLLKPALARGTLRTIAATAWADYRKYFEKDAALSRRFQVIKIEEPSEEKALVMLRGLATPLEKHHNVQILDEALEAAVQLSHRYIRARQLPDKAVSLLDTACARVAISQHAVPPEVEDSRRQIAALTTELEILGKESAVGIDHRKRTEELVTRIETQRAGLTALEERWSREKELAQQILEVRARLRGGVQSPAGEGAGAPEAAQSAAQPQAKATLDEVADLQARLAQIQGENPLVLPCVDRQAVATVVADWTGIPVGRMVKNEIQAVLNLAGTLGERVLGQGHALEAITKRIRTSRAGLVDPRRPIGVFMLVGPSGVGKTETALSLAEALYGGEQNLITINMSEFQESHTVSTLKGAPPGYVGYGEGGILTEAVRRRPYSVVLLDEVEKAHRDVHELFFQVFDKGIMEDGEGRMIDFKNTIILLTTNVGSELIMNLCKDPSLLPSPEGIAEALRESLLRAYPAAFLGRLVVIPYYPIAETVLQGIIRLQLGRIQKRLAESHGIDFTFEDSVVELIRGRCREAESGARVVDAILTHSLLPEISREFLTHLVANRTLTRLRVGADKNEFTYKFE
jgi:type VI secretion system protein VasG